MRRTIALGLFALLAAGAANNSCAQRRGGGGASFARGGRGFSGARAVSRYGYGYLPYGLSDAYLPYDSGDGYSNALQPVVFVQQPPQWVEPAAPPAVEAPAQAVITEYKWPATAASSSSAPSTTAESESQDFVLVLKNGSTLSAVAVFASDDGLHYVDADERHACISMSQVDRAATLKLNRARNLNLYLPAAQ